jgi:GT2 family glycosyltransferase
LIVVDNNSNDGTEELVTSYNDHRIIYLKIDNGGVIARSRNKAVRHSKGRFLAFLDADDYWLPDKLECCLVLIHDYDVIYHNMFLKKEYGRLSLRVGKARPLSGPVAQNLLLFGNPLLNSGVCVRRTINGITSYLSEEYDLRGLEDFEFWVRLATMGAHFGFIPKCLGVYRIWSGNSTSSLDERSAGLERVYERYLPILSPSEVRVARRRLCYLRGRVFLGNNQHLDAVQSFVRSTTSVNIEMTAKSAVFTVLALCRMIIARIRNVIQG